MRSIPALVLIAILSAALAQHAPGDLNHEVDARAGVQAGTPLVSIPVLVTDVAMHFVTGLEQRNFRVFEGKTEQVITQFSKADSPLSIGIIFDTSGSMGNKLRRSREAVAEFLKTTNKEDEFFLVCFSDRAHLMVGMTPDAGAIQSRLAFTRAKGHTALVDGVYMAIDQMKQARHPRKALFIISDGGDNFSQYSEAEIRKAIHESDIQIYAIRVYEPMPSGAGMSEERSGNGLLRELCRQTGGEDFDVGNQAELPGAAAKIGLELRNEYVLGYTPKNVVKGGKYRLVQVKLVKTVGSPQLTFRTRYYAPPP
jgi:Ca-activated chloride channel family protein